MRFFLIKNIIHSILILLSLRCYIMLHFMLLPSNVIDFGKQDHSFFHFLRWRAKAVLVAFVDGRAHTICTHICKWNM